MMIACATSLFVLVLPQNSAAGNTASYRMTRLESAGTQTRTVANKSSCFSQCIGKISAVSFSPVDQSCIASTCGNLKLIVDARWDTLVCGSLVIAGCSYPRPKFEWMITDTCGYLNTGWYNPGLPMKPSIGFKPTNMPYTVSLGAYNGLSVQYPGIENYNANTPVSNLALDFRKSYTLFAYFNSSSPNFALIEFGEMKSNGYYVNEQFEIAGSHLYHNFVLGCTGDCLKYYQFNAVPNTWTSAAMVFDASSSRITIYMNSTAIGSAIITYIVGPSSSNVVVTGGRPTSVLNNNAPYGSISGSTRCVKVFEVALTPDQVRSVSDSCIDGLLLF